MEQIILLCIYKDGREHNLEDIKIFKIKFNQIKNLDIWFKYSFPNDDYLFKTMFSFDIKNSLVSLHLQFSYFVSGNNAFENINKLQALRNLYMKYFTFEKEFKLKLKNLENLTLYYC